MNQPWTRRQLLKRTAASTTLLLTEQTSAKAQNAFEIASSEVEIRVAAVSRYTFRLAVTPANNPKAAEIPVDGSLVQPDWPSTITRIRDVPREAIPAGDMRLKFTSEPLQISIETIHGESIQQLEIDSATGVLSFGTAGSLLLGLGEGGRQFDRRGSIDTMRNGQGGYQLGTHGGRVPIPWLIGSAGWAIFVHFPSGQFDLSGDPGKFIPSKPLPLDLFFVSSREPATIMAEYARLTGHAQLPPLWALGYQQSHRTLSSNEQVLEEAKTFREKKLPCDALIYLGTGFCPSGWNTENGSFEWNSRVFPDPKSTIDRLHEANFRVVLHVVILTDRLQGDVQEGCEVTRFDEQQAACYWDVHRKDFALGVDGWWPDEGDPLDQQSRLVRNRMYWEGAQVDRPDERPYALHRNGYAGMQRYGAFLWSGDVYSTWETLRVHVSNAINTALTGIPYWGTDIGGFVPTAEFTAELYVRWFQFGAFCPLFRAHGRNWTLRLPWGWNTGDLGPMEISNYRGAALPDPSQLHNVQVEPICRKFLELRYRMLPYLYSVVRECALSGMPVIRALWLEYPEDATAVGRGDEYLWGLSLLVAPVVERGATSRKLYLPQGAWFDFWTGERIDGGREINARVDLATMPLYVRAGSILPLGPVKQHTGEKIDEPLAIHIYPGRDCRFLLYEDDGVSFRYRTGEWMGIDIGWNDRQRVTTLELAEGSRMLAALPKHMEIHVNGQTQPVLFKGNSVAVRF